MLLLDSNLKSREVNELIEEVKAVDGVKSVLGMESVLGPSIPGEMVPERLRKIFDNGEYEMLLIMSEYKVATDEVNEQLSPQMSKSQITEVAAEVHEEQKISDMEVMCEDPAENKDLKLGGPFYKRPKGEKGEIVNAWYNRKSIYVFHEEDFGGVLLSPEFPQILCEVYTKLMPMYEYLLAHATLPLNKK